MTFFILYKKEKKRKREKQNKNVHFKLLLV